MRILALDTATEACSVALGIGDRTVERYVEIERGHAEHILPMVEAVLAEAGLALAQLDALAFGRGPGGFTGVRLAASVAQGLAFGAGLGVVPVSDLAAVAQRAAQLHPAARRVLVVNDARMREVYWAGYGLAPTPHPTGDEQVSAPAGVLIPDEPAGSGAMSRRRWNAPPLPNPIVRARTGDGRGRRRGRAARLSRGCFGSPAGGGLAGPR